MTDRTIREELVRAAQARDFETISKLLSELINLIQTQSLAEAPRDDFLMTKVKPGWFDAIPSKILLLDDSLSYIDRANVPFNNVVLGHVLLRMIDEVSQATAPLQETSREQLFKLLNENGYNFTSLIHTGYRDLLQKFQKLSEASGAKGFRISSDKTKQNNDLVQIGSRKSQSVLEHYSSNNDAATPQSIIDHEIFDYGDEFKNFLCANPFIYGEIRTNGDLATCCYLPFTFGNIKRDGVENAWNSPVAKAVRRSILDGSYSFCDKKSCAAMQQISKPHKELVYDYQIPYKLFSIKEVESGEHSEIFKDSLCLESDGPKIVSFEDDASCNLSCPSCRVKPIMASSSESEDMYSLEVKLLDALGPKLEEVWFAGAGDPFVSRSYRRLYKEYDFERFPNLKFRFDTNGVPLTPKTWNELLGKVKHKVAMVCFSIDAASKEVYDITRVGGNFELLKKNLDFMKEVPERKSGMKLLLRMIVQRKNFREMKSFVELGRSLGVDLVVFSCIQNWGTFDQQDYLNQAVHLRSNPLHQELLEILKDPIFDEKFVNMGNLSDLYFAVREEITSSSEVQVINNSIEFVRNKSGVRAVAFYLPQFHPIPENNQWWGRGFTEWTNVAKAKPLYEGHLQPQLPADLGFYDLRVSETRELQADLAKQAGIEAFCYWHYWFAGRRILQRPWEEIVVSKKPNFGFCFGWANASWTGIWHGAPGKTLIEQTYPGLDDYKNHFYAMLPALRDERYFRVNGAPLILIYAPHELPNAIQFTAYWRELAHKEGLGNIHFVAHMQSNPIPFGCDSAVDNAPFARLPQEQMQVRSLSNNEPPKVWRYLDFVKYMREKPLAEREHPIVFPCWDNTPRSGNRGIVLHDSSPQLYYEHLIDAIGKAQKFNTSDERIVFIKAWNEWAEGNYLEPDQLYGMQRIEITKRALSQMASEMNVNTRPQEKESTIVVESENLELNRQIKVESSPSSPLNSTMIIIERADQMASKGDLLGAIDEISQLIAKGTSMAGMNMRLAEWNLALGKSDSAIEAAIKELCIRPDNVRAFDIAIHNRDVLVSILSRSTPNIVNLFQQIAVSYSG